MRDFRFRDDVGFERRCPLCKDWWPLTLEWWDRRWTNRCRACIRAWKRSNQNERYLIDQRYREDRKAAARLTAWKDRVNTPGKMRERKAAYYRANRERILEISRIRYNSRREPERGMGIHVAQRGGAE